ncbi:MAG: SurA N-terminal domain-containing protein, partial [Micavibrio aeruginosavorus]|nr:SurA N-terminal domain-containing protein [Micavibrio aeruginosavorus]
MTRFFHALIFAAALCGIFMPGARAEGIAAVVNEDAITISDLEERLRLMIVSSGMPYNQDIRDRLRGQVLNMLLDEALQMQEARASDITVA